MSTSDNSMSTSEQVFELTPNEESTPKSRGRLLRLPLYGLIIVLFGGIAAVQAKPELAEYLSFLPNIQSASAKHAPLPCCAAQAPCCAAQASCCSGGDTCSTEDHAIAVRPPAPAMPESLDITL